MSDKKLEKAIRKMKKNYYKLLVKNNQKPLTVVHW